MTSAQPKTPVAGFGPATHVFPRTEFGWLEDVDGRDKPGRGAFFAAEAAQEPQKPEPDNRAIRRPFTNAVPFRRIAAFRRASQVRWRPPVPATDRRHHSCSGRTPRPLGSYRQGRPRRSRSACERKARTQPATHRVASVSLVEELSK